MKKMNLMILYVAIGVLAVIFLCWGLLSVNSVVAVVNGQKIYKSEYLERLEAKSGLETMSQLIGEKLIEQAAKDNGIVIPNESVDEQLSKIKEQFGTSFDYILQSYGMSEQDLWGSLRMNMIVYEIATKDMTVTDSEVEEFFKNNREEFDEPEMYRANQIILATEDLAKEILDQLKSGANFADLALLYSTDVATKSSGGDLGFFARGTMPEEFDTAVFSKKVGDLVGPFKTEYGYHIVEIVDSKAAVYAKLEDIWDEVVKAVKADKAPSAEEMIAELSASSTIAVVNSKFDILESGLNY